MLSIANKPFVTSVITLSVVMLNVAAPLVARQRRRRKTFRRVVTVGVPERRRCPRRRESRVSIGRRIVADRSTQHDVHRRHGSHAAVRPHPQPHHSHRRLRRGPLRRRRRRQHHHLRLPVPAFRIFHFPFVTKIS
jgi:hypothetical protein